MMRKLIFILIFNFLFTNLSFSEVVKVNTLSNNKENYEKMEMLFGDYRIYTHRPGGIKIRRISDNKQMVVFSDKFKIKFYNDGDKLFDFILDEKKENITIKYKDIDLFTWKGKYISKHQAYFFQIITYNNQPFHYYINLKAKPSSALNIEKFELKIAKAVNKAKIQIAAKYNITPELIELILKKRKLSTDKKIEKIVLEEKDKLNKEIDKEIEDNIDKTLQASLSQEVAEQIEDSIGKEIAKEFDSIIIDGMEDELASIIDEAVEEAIAVGVSQATAEAAVRAVMDVLAKGGTEEEAMEACRAIAGDAC
jgi:outer membrane lipoprotein-sorting protein